MADYTKTNKYLLFVFILITFHLVANIIWISLNATPPTWDASLHTVLSIKYLEYLNSNLINFNFFDFLKISQYYPPFVHWVGSLFAFISNNEYKAVALSGTLFFSLSIYFLYLYTNELFQNKRVAFLTSFFFSFFLTIYQQSRQHMLDIPLTALIITGAYFLKKTDSFKNTTCSILFFLIFSLAFLTKWYSVIYFLVPLLFTFLHDLSNKRINRSYLSTCLWGFIIFILVTGPWYLTNLTKILEVVKITSTAEFWNPQDLFSLANLFFHLKLTIMFQITFLGFAFFLLSVGLLSRSRHYQKVTLLILSVIVFNYLFFTMISNKNVRYLMPLTPFFAMIMGFGADLLVSNKNKLISFLVILIIPYYILTYLILSFGIPVKPTYKYSANLPLIEWTDLLYLHTYPVRIYYQSKDTPYKRILEDLFSKKEGPIRVLILKDTEDLNNGVLDPYLYPEFRLRRSDFNYVGYDLLEGKVTDEQISNFLKEKVDIVLVAASNPGLRDYIREYDSLIRFQKYFLDNKALMFELTNQYELPGDNYYPPDTLLLYKKTS